MNKSTVEENKNSFPMKLHMVEQFCADLVRKWDKAPRSAEMFDMLKSMIQFSKNFNISNPQNQALYQIYQKQISWLENKLYPTAEELGIPPEDVEFMRSQMTKEDYEDLRDPDWFEFEKQYLI